MPDTPYSRNAAAHPIETSPFRPDSSGGQRLSKMADEVKQLREELRLLKETLQDN